MSISQNRSRAKRHNKWLELIAAYKLLHTMLFVAIGIGALQLLHKDLGDLLAALADRLHFDSESRLVDFVMDKASLINDPLLRRIGFVSFAYAVVTLVEGIGLYLEQAWGEYLTLLITASFMPLEIFEIVCGLTWFRVSLFAINLVVFVYLLQLVANRSRQRARATREIKQVRAA
jgi:uncharacterized membrane protein (DUF2068 family)